MNETGVHDGNRSNLKFIGNINCLPAPHKPEGLLPEWIESRFILWTNRKAVVETCWVLSPNSKRPANRKMYKHGSGNKENKSEFQEV